MNFMLKRLNFLVPATIICFLFLSFSYKGEERYVKVQRVIDGDTFVIESGGKKGERVRLIGIDAPETRKTARKEVGYYGQEAKEYLRSMLTGKNVKLVFDVGKKDRYGRLLAYVYIGGKFVNADLVEQGYAVTYSLAPNVQYADFFIKLERRARVAKRGLWN
ncbi:thermonuclease family protein [Sphingobacterium prati]|uniref:thermonuclease family protein n=2 Tax=Sphingobacterium prati TaxID=2737006 RepID=UPI0015555C8F|nr:thermonuclease family protein [Sphingobacterium prati]NPE48643.1 thermonuclease family protein [Sphingobacterium prati]